MAIDTYTHNQDTIIDNYTKQLLSKNDDDEIDVELYGYPAEHLDDPREKNNSLINEQCDALIDGNDYFGFKMCSVINGNFYPGNILSYTRPMLLLDFGMKKAYINTKKLQSLLYDHIENAVIKTQPQGEIFYVKLSKQMLLDNILINSGAF
jgi:hypothetical protein